MRVVTYNIRYGLGQDGRYDVDRCAAAVAAADVIALQEVEVHWPRSGDEDQAVRIAAALPDHHWVYNPAFDVDASSGGAKRRRQFGTMLLSRTPILSTRRYPLPKVATTAEFNMVNSALEGVVATPAGAVRVVSLHLSHLTEEERLLQVDALLAWHRAAAGEGGAWTGRDEPDVEGWSLGAEPPMPAAAILLGDFNSEPDGRVYPRMAGGGFVDAWAAAGNEGRPCLTWSPYAHATIQRDRRLDYVFVTPDLAPRVRRAWVNRGALGSDHYPYWVDVDL